MSGMSGISGLHKPQTLNQKPPAANVPKSQPPQQNLGDMYSQVAQKSLQAKPRV